MRRSIVAVVLLALLFLTGYTTFAQEQDSESILRFEAAEGAREGETLRGWGGGPAETIHLDSTIVHSGSGAARLVRDAHSPSDFTSITGRLPIDFDGQWLELRGFLRTEGVSGYAGLWMREDGPSGRLQFDNMYDRGLRGTTDWTEYTIRLPLDAKAGSLFYGVLLSGEGTVWADDLQLLVDGEPIAQAPKRTVEQTTAQAGLEADREFDNGSRIEGEELAQQQTRNLATLGKVWGFLKYHHPRVTSGEVHWDYELFRVLPQILDAADRDASNAALLAWVDRLGEPPPCDPCAQPPLDTHLQPELDWIRDTGALGTALSGYLVSVHENRHAVGPQHHVSLAPSVRNPVFSNEKAYAGLERVDGGFRLLALYRFWNIIEYWFPYRDVIGEDWDAVLSEFVPRFFSFEDPDDYRLQLIALAARVRDTHTNLWGSLDVRPPRGSCQLPVVMRFVEGRAVVEHLLELSTAAPQLRVGDVLVSLDDRPVASLVEAWSPFYAASNVPKRLLDIARTMTRGECGGVQLEVERGGQTTALAATRVPVNLGAVAGRTHDLSGDTFRLLSEGVAYLKLSSVKSDEVADYIRAAAGTRGLVIDIRNYPGEFVVFSLGSLLVAESTQFARFTKGVLESPGAFIWTPPLALVPQEPHYEGRVVILVDEVSLSQAEYTAMAFRVAPGALVVGSTTAGADGNVSPIPLPGGLQSLISGIGVFYPDKTPTQRVGIVPDVEAHPTIEGIRAGRDEVLEEALRQIFGDEITEEEIRTLARGKKGAGGAAR